MLDLPFPGLSALDGAADEFSDYCSGCAADAFLDFTAFRSEYFRCAAEGLVLSPVEGPVLSPAEGNLQPFNFLPSTSEFNEQTGFPV